MASCELYLDHAATSPMSSKLASSLMRYHLDYPYNSETVYEWGLAARRVLEEARAEIKVSLKWQHELVFTSGGTESNNLALKVYAAETTGVIWYSQTAHPSLTNPIKSLASQGWTLVPLPLSKGGVIDLEKAIDLPSPTIVAMEWVNSEVGFIQPVETFSAWLKQTHVNAKFIIDAVQGVGKLPCLNPKNIDALVFSGHKFGAPIGVGALAFKAPKRQTPLQYGGGQESGWRSGTVAIANILCLRDALVDAYQAIEKKSNVTELSSDLFYRVEGVAYSPYIAMLNTAPVDGEVLLHQLEARAIAVGLGSACQASKKKPSQTLQLLGFQADQARKTLRMSWTPQTSPDKVQHALEIYRELHLKSIRYYS